MLKALFAAILVLSFPAVSHAASYLIGADTQVSIEIPDAWNPGEDDGRVLAASQAGTRLLYEGLAMSDQKAAAAAVLGGLESLEFVAAPDSRSEMNGMTINGMACNAISYDGTLEGDPASALTFFCRPDENSTVSLTAIFVGPSQKTDDLAFQAILDSLTPLR